MMASHPDDTDLHIRQLRYMIEEQGLNLNEESGDGLTIVDELLYEVQDALSEAHTRHFDQMLLWVCERVTPTEEMINQFHHTGRYHALEEILKRYEGPIISFRGRYLELDYVEVLLGYENVVDVESMGKRYRELVERHYEWPEGHITFFKFFKF